MADAVSQIKVPVPPPELFEPDWPEALATWGCAAPCGVMVGGCVLPIAAETHATTNMFMKVCQPASHPRSSSAPRPE